MNDNPIYNVVKTNINNYINTPVVLGKYVTWSLHETIEKIEAYARSKHVSGEKDASGRDKPFFNITTSAENIWYRATDIDRSNIRIKADKSSNTLGAALANIHLHDWMRRNNFGAFLNNWGRALTRYGSSVIKFVEKDGNLHSSVVPWNRLIVDQVDFDKDIVIEKLFLTPSEIRKRGYDKEAVEGLLDSTKARRTIDGQKVDNNANFIELYEVHGEMPLSYLTDNEDDEDTYEQQMHVVTFTQGEEDGETTNHTLIRGKETKTPYMITHLIEEEGRVLGIGSIEHLFESQWMINHSQKAIKDQLDLASQLIYQTSDPSFVGQNTLDALQTGDILVHSPNQPLTQLANNSHDITSLQNFSLAWKELSKEIVSTPDAISGNTMPSGTAYRQVAVLNQEAHSLFELMIENKALAIEDMLRMYVIPFLKKKMDTADEIHATLGDVGVDKIDLMFIKGMSNKIALDLAKKDILSGKIHEGINEDDIKSMVTGHLADQGGDRYFVPSDIDDTTWKDIFKDLEWEVEVEVSGEDSNKEAIMTSLTTVLQTIATNPMVLQDPNGKLLFNKILETSGSVSPIELKSAQAQPSPEPQNAPVQATSPQSPQTMPTGGK